MMCRKGTRVLRVAAWEMSGASHQYFVPPVGWRSVGEIGSVDGGYGYIERVLQCLAGGTIESLGVDFLECELYRSSQIVGGFDEDAGRFEQGFGMAECGVVFLSHFLSFSFRIVISYIFKVSKCIIFPQHSSLHLFSEKYATPPAGKYRKELRYMQAHS